MSDYTPTTEEVKANYAFVGDDEVVNNINEQKFDRWLEQNDIETQKMALAWERERFDRLWQIEMDVCKCEEAMQHLKVRMGRTENGIDYDAEFGDNE